MPLSFYKPNPSNRGSACSFRLNSKDGAVYVEFIKQTSWNPNTKHGAFKGGEKGGIKLGLHEIGSILDVIEKTLASKSNIYRLKTEGENVTEQLVSTSSPQKVEFSTFHNSTKRTQIKFGTYFSGEVFKGFSFGITQTNPQDSTDKQNFIIGFTVGEAVVVREYLQFALFHCFSAIYSVDKKYAVEYAKKMEEQDSGDADGSIHIESEETPKQESKPAPAQEEDDDIF